MICPWIDFSLVFKPVCKLNRLSRLKCKIPSVCQSNLVYKVSCKDCDEFYVGMTSRRLEQRISEHSSDSKSALFKHRSTTGHSIDFKNPKIIAKDNMKVRLLIKESLMIQSTQTYKHLNKNIGPYELKLW